MSKAIVLCMNGVEEVECLTVVDFCRRADIEVRLASVTGKRDIEGSHGIRFLADTLIGDLDTDEYDALIFPGGPGAKDLVNAPGIRDLAIKFANDGRLLAAICASPGELSEAGIYEGKVATGYPGCKPKGKARWTERPTERDGNLITGRGPAAAALFAVEIIRFLKGDKTARKISQSTTLSG